MRAFESRMASRSVRSAWKPGSASSRAVVAAFCSRTQSSGALAFHVLQPEPGIGGGGIGGGQGAGHQGGGKRDREGKAAGTHGVSTGAGSGKAEHTPHPLPGPHDQSHGAFAPAAQGLQPAQGKPPCAAFAPPPSPCSPRCCSAPAPTHRSPAPCPPTPRRSTSLPSWAPGTWWPTCPTSSRTERWPHATCTPCARTAGWRTGSSSSAASTSPTAPGVAYPRWCRAAATGNGRCASSGPSPPACRCWKWPRMAARPCSPPRTGNSPGSSPASRCWRTLRLQTLARRLAGQGVDANALRRVPQQPGQEREPILR
ncbi:MAG: hypothetical protein KatS3mg127_1345 [Silanimonas sp.]|nr:MAG: hypothetical protein KatS3mg127_1345 [Silanimonas sp.]